MISIKHPILFIDDDPRRAIKMTDFAGEDVAWRNTFGRAVKELVTPGWSMIMLDHDLESEMDQDGQKLAEIIVELQRHNDFFSNTMLLIHSVNSIGARQMHRILDRPDLDLNAPATVPFDMLAIGS
jgi:hypothetical protein